MKSYRTKRGNRLRAEAEVPAIAEKIAPLADRPIRKISLTITPATHPPWQQSLLMVLTRA
jgi:hypothetical protein